MLQALSERQHTLRKPSCAHCSLLLVLQWACILGFFASIILVGVAVILLWVQLPERINFATIADDATFSYRALRVGTLPADNEVSWRSNALTDDSGPGGASLTGELRARCTFWPGAECYSALLYACRTATCWLQTPTGIC